MKINSFVNGLILLCPLILSACTSTPPLPAVRHRPIARNWEACQLPALQPQSNEDLSRALLDTENAWHQCAAQVDMTISCQERIDAKAQLIRELLAASVPHLQQNPDALRIFINKGAGSSPPQGAAPVLNTSTSLELLITDYAADPDTLMVLLVGWMSLHQQEALRQ